MKYYLIAYYHRLDGKRNKIEIINKEEAYFQFVRLQGNVDRLVMYEVENGKRTIANKSF